MISAEKNVGPVVWSTEHIRLHGLNASTPRCLDGLNVICAVLGCDVEEVLLPEPDSVPAPTPASTERAAAIGQDRAVRPVEHRAGIPI